jgi:hypothetical protein
MKLSIRLAALVVTAVAFAGVAGAQQRGGGHGGSSRSSGGHTPQARSQPSRTASRSFARQDVRAQRNAAPRAEFRGRNDVQARTDFRGRTDLAARSDFRGRVEAGARVDVRGRDAFRPVGVAEHGRPLITRSGFVTPRGYERGAAFRGARFGVGFNRWGGRLVLPIGWGNRVVFGGFFPAAYGGYCEAVPYDYDYLLPPMAPSYDPCLFGDRIVVYDRFSRSIVFVAAL